MALVTVKSLKLRFKIEDCDSDELLAELLATAIAQVETFIGRVILDDPANPRTFGTIRAEYPRVRGLRVSDQAPNDRFAAEGYDSYGREINAVIADPTTVSGTLALSTLPDYPRLEAVCNQAIADTVADIYFRPNSLELLSREGGADVGYGRLTHGLPPRVRSALKPIRNLTQI